MAAGGAYKAGRQIEPRSAERLAGRRLQRGRARGRFGRGGSDLMARLRSAEFQIDRPRDFLGSTIELDA
jgi:hypothetical protein